MKNIEKYEHEISKLVNEDNVLSCAIATVAGIRKERPCYHQDCEECHKKCLEWMYEDYKEQILSDDEKEIVKAMCDFIYKFGCEVNYVRKYDGICGKAYILLSYTNSLTKYSDSMTTPWFKNDKFKGMEIEKEYKLEELGITCQTQKDN